VFGEIQLYLRFGNTYLYVIRVNFAYVFVLDRNFVQSQPLKSAVPTSLNPVL